jgi:hypothetical protein
MNSEFNGRSERAAESEAQFWRSMETLLPIFEREGTALHVEAHPDDFVERYARDSFRRRVIETQTQQCQVHPNKSTCQLRTRFSDSHRPRIGTVESRSGDHVGLAGALETESIARER